jgi:hypothetical protein
MHPLKPERNPRTPRCIKAEKYGRQVNTALTYPKRRRAVWLIRGKRFKVDARSETKGPAPLAVSRHNA